MDNDRDSNSAFCVLGWPVCVSWFGAQRGGDRSWRHRRREVTRLARSRGRGVEVLEPRHLLAGNAVITEFMAKNDGLIEDGDGKSPDWIEIQNIGDAALDLAGFQLTDTPRNPARWTFPTVVVNPGDYLVVFASGQEVEDYVDAGGNLHTNFSLSAGGEYLALSNPEGTTLSEFGDAQTSFIEQKANISYGVPQHQTLVDEQTDLSYWVPTDSSVDLSWTQADFDALANGFAAGKAALGFERRPTPSGDFGPLILTELPETASAVYALLDFDLEHRADVDRLDLQLKYDDGFVAYLNGVKIAEDNAPAELDWTSTATGRHSDRQASEFEDFDLRQHIPVLKEGRNTLAIHGLNSESDSSDMLIVPRLSVAVNTSDAASGYMAAATPGAPNVGHEDVYSGLLGQTEVDVEAGFFDVPFHVTVSSESPGVEIRYTTDGSHPTAKTGQVYSEPIQIETTTTLRTAAFLDDHMPSDSTTHSYLFLRDVIRQSADQPGLPTRWQQPGFGFPADYAMDQDIVNNPAYHDEIVDGLRSIPTMSIVIQPDDFLGPEGIYIKTGGHGPDSERPVSIEIIDPAGSLALRVNAGLRNHGNRTRDFDVTLKQSFRLVFSARNGPRKLAYPLFPDSPAEQFDNIILHAGKLLDDPQLVRNSFGRDTNRAMGNVDGHSIYVHLYFNGLYWGLYNPFERADAQFAEEYFGGSEEDYDAILNNSERVDGDTRRYTAMWRMLRSGLPTEEEYEEFRRHIDLNSLFDLLLANQYMAHDEHELRAIGNRVGDPTFRFFAQDMDEGGMKSINARMSMGEFLPGRSYQQLVDHRETRMLYADRAHKHLFNGGALTPEVAEERWLSRVHSIESAVIAETARWGDTHWRSVFPRKAVERDVELMREQTFLTERFFPRRTQVIVNQLRRAGVYPDVDAPVLSQFGGSVLPDFPLTMTHPNEEGTILYTLDGTDPRQFGGTPSAVANVYDGSPISLAADSILKARVLSGEEWSALSEAEFSVVTGDLNADGQTDASDIDWLCVGIHEGNPRFDLDGSGAIDQSDLLYFVRTTFQTDVGDANLDGLFDLGDLRTAEFEDNVVGNSTWADGDWNCDGEFDSADLVLAFKTGSFETAMAARAAVVLEGVATRLAHDRYKDSLNNGQKAPDQQAKQLPRAAEDDDAKTRAMPAYAWERAAAPRTNDPAGPRSVVRKAELLAQDLALGQMDDLLADLL